MFPFPLTFRTDRKEPAFCYRLVFSSLTGLATIFRLPVLPALANPHLDVSVEFKTSFEVVGKGIIPLQKH